MPDILGDDEVQGEAAFPDGEHDPIEENELISPADNDPEVPPEEVTRAIETDDLKMLRKLLRQTSKTDRPWLTAALVSCP